MKQHTLTPKAEEPSSRKNPSVTVGALPPGQTATQKFPLVGEKHPPPEALDPESWRLEIGGLVERPLTLTYEQIRQRPTRQRQVDIHCVTGWSQFGMSFGGFPLQELLDETGCLPEAAFVRFEAYSERSHDTSLPLALAMQDTWLVHSFDGKPLTPEHGFPLRTLTPSRYFFKSLKWVRRIELLSEERLGFWERESFYHNEADPWPGDQRFTSGSVKPQQLEKIRQAKSLRSFRGPKKLLIGIDLREWNPADRDLRELHLKNCDLRGAHLQGVDLRGANLSLCDLRQADLRGADLRQADIEGANLCGADLREADLRDTFLSATRFFVGELNAPSQGARVAGLRFEGGSGLLESQESYLLRHSTDASPEG